MKTILVFFQLSVLLGLNLQAQINDDAIRQTVLKNNITNKLHVFGKWDKTGGTETHLNYLGELKTSKGNFKIMTSCWFWGTAKRATSRILVFDANNNYLGNYYLIMQYDLPEKIENNAIVFQHSMSDVCDKGTVTRVSFEHGIPESFFLACKEGDGYQCNFREAD